MEINIWLKFLLVKAKRSWKIKKKYGAKLKLLLHQQIKVKALITSTNNSSDDYDEKYMKIKFHSDDDLPLKKTLELYDIMIVVRSVFNDGSKYYPHVFLDYCFSKLGGPLCCICYIKRQRLRDLC